MNSLEENDEQKPQVSSLKEKFRFPSGATLLIFYQLIAGMGSYCFILSMPLFMASILKFSDVMSTTIYHAKSGVGMILNILGAILADGVLGRSKTFLSFYPVNLILLGSIAVMAIFIQTTGIIVSYFLLAIVGGIVNPAIRTIIADQIPQGNKIMLSTYLHIIYFVNNFGVIIVAFAAPIMHKDIYCFHIECYPLVFFVAFLLSSCAFSIFLIGFLMKLFVIFKPTNNLLLNIFRCSHLAVVKRIELGKPMKGQSWLDYCKEKYDEHFINDLKIAKGLLIFLLAHPLFWTVFEQISSIWTLQAQYLDGRITDSFVIKADQMQTLNPVLVVILIPIFEGFIYPVLDRINIKSPYRIMSGQMFTALACVSMALLQFRLDRVIEPESMGMSHMNLINIGYENLTVLNGLKSEVISQLDVKRLSLKDEQQIFVKGKHEWLNISVNEFRDKAFSTIIFQNEMKTNSISQTIDKQQNAGYTNVRLFNNLNTDFNITVQLRAKYGINKHFSLLGNRNHFGNYVKCAIGLFDVYINGNWNATDVRKIGEITLFPAEAKTIIITGNQSSVNYIDVSEFKFILPSILWQLIPYILLTIGEVLFNVNTGIFLYGEAPISMKSLLLASEYSCIALGNMFILILRQFLKNVSTMYLFIICSVLVALSGLFTGILGYFYLKNKDKRKTETNTSCDSTAI